VNSERESVNKELAAVHGPAQGLVSKRRDRPYQAGRSKHWIKVKNRKHHAFDRCRKRIAGGPDPEAALLKKSGAQI